MKKIKILVDAHVFENSFQGTTTYIKGLYNHLVHYNDFEITLCSNNISNLKKIFISQDFKFIKLNSKSTFSRLFIEYPKILKSGNYDYAHFQYIVPLGFKYCKYINTIHDLLFMDFKSYFPWYYRFIRTKLFSYSATKSDVLLTVSEYSKRDIYNKFNIKLNKIHVTPNGVSISSKKNITYDVKAKYNIRNYIHYVSRFESRKNQLGLLKVYLNLKLYEKGIDLVFIGRYTDKIEKDAYDEVLKLVPKNLNNRVFFIHDIEEEELENFHKQSLCFVYPSLAEGFGIPPIEAAINGCKVLCSNLTAMSDFNFFSYNFNPENNVDFAEKLLKILQDEYYPFEEIKNIILEKYNWRNISSNFKEVIINNFRIK
ncbi:glycosyltransferase family 1 protein [Apibacter muscae]|uniref:glycosyltransferase family 4 protein n=1 Tax=Apibacter muscae TaxID=2509004 RepID=UPI0011ABD43C|nr:glycosyltransferase family 1 protein [Apibacter muscae]TWP23749.1 glycosyltransferase family 1 protein [Apibacter muscae]